MIIIIMIIIMKIMIIIMMIIMIVIIIIIITYLYYEAFKIHLTVRCHNIQFILQRGIQFTHIQQAFNLEPLFHTTLVRILSHTLISLVKN